MIGAMRLFAGIIAVLGFLARGVPCAAAGPASSVQELVGATSVAVRSVGTDGARGSADLFAAQLAGATGERVFRQRFRLAVPILDGAEARAGEKAFAIYPLLPSGGQIPFIAGGATEAEIVYAGRGDPALVRGRAIARRWVALELDSGEAWKTFADLGAAGILFVSNGNSPATDFLDKTTHIPIGLARFYTQDAELVSGLRNGSIGRLTLACRAHWEERAAENLLCLIPARHAAAAVAGEPFFLLSARYDGTSQVVGLSPGATEAANAAGVILLAQRISAAPEHAGVLVALTGGDEFLLSGTRHLHGLLMPEQRDGARAVAELGRQLAEAEAGAEAARETRRELGTFLQSGVVEGSAAAALRDALDRRLWGIDEQLQRARLAGAGPVADAGAAALAAAKQLHMAAGAALARGEPPSPEEAALLMEVARGIAPQWARAAARAEGLGEDLRQNMAFRRYVGDRALTYHFALELTAGCGSLSRFGLFDRSSYLHNDEPAARLGEFDRIVRRRADELGRGALDRYVPETLSTLPTLESWLPVPRAFSTDISLAHGLPGATFATVQDAATPLDTPGDTAVAFSAEAYMAQWNQVALLLLGDGAHKGVLTDPDFHARTGLAAVTDSQTIRVAEPTLGDPSAHLGTPGALVGAWQERSTTSFLLPPMQGTRAFDFEITGIDGSATFTGLINTYFALQAFTFRPDGGVARALAQSADQQSGGISVFSPDSAHAGRAMLFEARRLDLFALFDPRYGQALDHLTLLDARRRDAVGTGSQFIDRGMAALFFPPDTRWQLLASRGDLGNRMILINATAGNPDGEGFATTDAADIGPLAWRAARDFAALDAKRNGDLERRGISSAIIDDLRASAAGELSAAEAARQALDYPAWLAHAGAAWSYESQAYAALISTSNGIIHGVIFLLLAIIPFSYFLERLLFGFTSVYRQIVAFACIFAAMTGGLWFHPAFRISAAPIMILLAFFIILLSSLVVFLLFGKFEEEIARLRGAAVAAHSGSLRRAAVLGAAVRLGLSNMRRRGMRTALTLLTLILLTFTLLCFTSVRESLGLVPQVLADGPKNAVPAILLRNPGWRALWPEMIPPARAAAGDGGGLSQRWWLASDTPETLLALPIRRMGAAVNARDVMTAGALLGLDTAEGEFHAGDLEKLLPGWHRFSTGENVCLLPITAQAGGAVRVGDEVTLLGHRLIVAGFFNPNALENFRQLTGDSMMPVNPSSVSAAADSRPRDQATSAEPRYDYLDPRQVAIVPIPVVRALGGRLSSVILRPADGAKILPAAQSLARQWAFSIIVCTPGGGGAGEPQIRSYNAAASSVPQNLDRVLVPMVLAGIIVLNTMLGAVAERSREIHAYTSLGLAPSHVATLFLAEAAALGTLGVVFGYIFGQGLATVLSYFHLLEGVDLNYSSAGALLTVSLVLGIVMLSALWPAHTAARIAAPSLRRDWKLPRPVGDLLQVELPFTVNAAAARGICAFLEEYFLSVAQTGAARFTTDALKTFSAYANSTFEISDLKSEIPPIRGFHCRVWLAPYDLGVIQKFWLAIHPTGDPHVFEVHLTLIREAGSPSAWLRLNRPFLTEVRKQFLLWRALSPEAMHDYVLQSAKLFAHAEPVLPPTTFRSDTAKPAAPA